MYNIEESKGDNLKNKALIKFILTVFVCQGASLGVLAVDNSSDIIDIITLSPLSSYAKSLRTNSYNNNLTDFEFAMEKFSQSNITAAYRDFGRIIHTNNNDDFLYFNLAYEFSEIGFFSLAQNAIVQINDRQIWLNQIDALKNVYFPSVTMSLDEELYLASFYADVVYNNMAQEAIKELSKDSKILKKLDYANFVLSLAYYKERNYSKALSYINKALAFDNTNLNYLKFKAQILSDEGKFKDSNDIISEIRKKSVVLANFNRNLDLLFLYNVANATRNKYERRLAFANYYIESKDFQKASKELNWVISKKKKYHKAYSLLGVSYLKQRNIDRAKECFEKAYKINKKYPQTLVGLGKVNYEINDWTKSQYFYKQALKYDDENFEANLGLSLIALAKYDYQNANKYINAASIIEKENYMTSYILSKIDKEKSEQYLKQALSINPMFSDAWLDLAQIALDENNFAKAQKNLLPVKLISPNDNKYLEMNAKLNNRFDI